MNFGAQNCPNNEEFNVRWCSNPISIPRDHKRGRNATSPSCSNKNGGHVVALTVLLLLLVKDPFL